MRKIAPGCYSITTYCCSYPADLTLTDNKDLSAFTLLSWPKEAKILCEKTLKDLDGKAKDLGDKAKDTSHKAKDLNNKVKDTGDEAGAPPKAASKRSRKGKGSKAKEVAGKRRECR